MLFNSLSFLVFFPLVVCLYFLLPSRFRILLLLLASCYFYMAFVPVYVLILFFLIITDFFLGQAIEKREGVQRKFFLVLSVITNVGTLFFFKYFNFFNQSIADFGQFIHWNYSPFLLTIILPLGLSFHVFQSLSYVIEVYKGKYPAERNFLTYALYVMFFPQLVAGPIERPQHLLPQFKIEHTFEVVRVRRGLERMMWGFFKKLVIADQLAVIIDPLYAQLPADGPTLFLLMFLFSYQLYCDFSGYSDIAIGSAQVLGFELSENFKRPFSAHSMAEYWRRWHISLSSWLRDYLYYPLAMGWGTISKTRLYFSLFVTFVLIGLWHGANWTFVIFGALHGMYLVVGQITEKWRKSFKDLIGLSKLPKVQRVLQIGIIFALASFAHVFFRVPSIADGWFFISHLTDNLGNLFDYEYVRYSLFRGLGLFKFTFLVVLISIISMEIIQYYQEKFKTFYVFEKKSKKVRYLWYYGLVMIILFFGYFGAQSFIYFQF
jgi:alginate O-acetyltransferase complex protein AlgI